MQTTSSRRSCRRAPAATFSYQSANERAQGSDDGTLCISAGGDPSLSWSDVQEVAAAAAQRQQLLPVPFTSLIVDASIYSGDVTPDTWEWGDLWAVSAAPLLRPHDFCDFLLWLRASRTTAQLPPRLW